MPMRLLAGTSGFATAGILLACRAGGPGAEAGTIDALVCAHSSSLRSTTAAQILLEAAIDTPPVQMILQAAAISPT